MLIFKISHAKCLSRWFCPLYRSVRKKYSNRNMLRLHDRGMYEAIFPENSSNDMLEVFKKNTQVVYAGFDPTAASLHVGNLIVLMNLLHWQRSGHQVIALIGGATALIGDPSGRHKDREKQEPSIVREQSENIVNDIQTVLRNHETYFWKTDNDNLKPCIFLNNADWYQKLDVISFLNNVGRHFRMGTMLLKESVARRLESEHGMCFTEFTYQIFQAYDWLLLFQNHNCRFQIGGKDQMGNIVAGHNLISHLLRESPFGLTLPLITNDAGDKFGKSVSNAVWLNPNLTTPFEFYQFFMRVEDHKVEQLLKLFTFLIPNKITSIMKMHKEHPEKREAQKILSENVTLLVHGKEGLKLAKTTTSVLYEKNLDDFGKLNVNDLPNVLKGAAIVDLKFKPGYTVLQFALDIPCFVTKGDALRIIHAGGFSINQQKVMNENEVITHGVHILPNDATLVRLGKKHYWVVRWTE